MSEHEVFYQPSPTCPGCGYVMTDDDMLGDFSDDDLFAIAPNEEQSCIQCPNCDNSYWVQGGYRPYYTSSFNEYDL